MRDRQVRNAARRVEDARRHQRLGRTGLEAERAGAALVERRPVSVKRKAADNLREKNPRPELRVNHARVLANPAEPGVLRVHALLNRSGVHVRPRLEWIAMHVAHPCQQRVEPCPEDIVIIVAPGISRDVRAIGIAARD